MTKPFLRDGKPTNARPPPPLDTGLQKLCQCRLCISSTALSPKFLETREATQGQWLDERTFQRHQREENLLRAVEKAGMDGPQYTALLRKPVESDLIARRRAPHKPPARPVVPPAGNPNSTQRQEIEVGEGALAPVIASGTVVSARNMDRGAGRGGEAVGGGAGDAGARRSERKKAVDDLTTSVEESKTDLQHICSNINSRVLSFYPPRRLVFARQPMIDTPFLRRPLEQLSEINRGQFALHPGDPANAPILALENDLVRWLGDIDAIPSFGNSAIVAQRRDLSDRIFRELDRMDDFKEQEWERQRRGGASTGDARMKADLYIDTEIYFNQPYRTWSPVVLSCHLVLLLMHLLCGLSRRSSTMLLAGFRTIVRLSLVGSASSVNVIGQIPKDPRTVISSFDLDPRTRSYACCPKCFALFDATTYPDVCTHKATPASRSCGTKLGRTRQIRGKTFKYPIRTYLHQEMKEWMARLMSRPGLEDLMDNSLSRSSGEKAGEKADIWDAHTFNTFNGPDGKRFLDAPIGEGRYIFSLAVDGFNPFNNKTAKQKGTVTGMYMICLNLPPDIRYLPENMYLIGLIPGPTKPSVDQINHFLKPLVDDMLPFWDPGVKFSRTAKYPEGRLVRLVLIPLVCDLPAARQVAGLSSHRSTNFCSYCYLTLDDIDDLDRDNWVPRTYEEHLKHATAWRDAETLEERESIFAAHGVRWSELLRLPYWNPIHFVVVESMHALYLGLLHHHCRDVWGMTTGYDDGTESAPKKKNKAALPPSTEAMEAGLRALMGGSRSALNACAKAVLYQLCLERDLRRASTKKQLIKSLMQWREDNGMDASPLAGDHRLVRNELESKDDVEAAKRVLMSRDHIQPLALVYFHKVVLINLCKAHHLRTNGNKEELVDTLITWRISNNLQDPPPENTHQLPLSAPGARPSLGGRLHDEQEAILLLSSDVVEPSALLRYTKNVLVSLCKTRSLAASGNKDVLVARLIDWKTKAISQQPLLIPATAKQLPAPTRDARSTTSQPVAGNPPVTISPPAVDNPRILGKQLMSEVHKDMQLTELPTWVSRAPANMGSSIHGKLSADQWRSASTICFPITLIRLWGDKTDKRKEMLDNFMDLVIAVEIGCMMVITDQHIESYDAYLLRYLKKYKVLYKNGRIVSYHHIARHLREFLCSFGPVHAWRSFAFERYNYIFQQENTNQKFGELEMTFMNHTCRSANYRPLLRDPNIRDTMTELINSYELCAGEDRRGTRVRDVLQWDRKTSTEGQPLKTNRDIALDDLSYRGLLQCLETEKPGYYALDEQSRLPQQRLINRAAVLCSKVFIGGVTYRPKALSSPDANIIFRRDETRTSAGRIINIVLHTRRSNSGTERSTETFVFVERLVELTEEDSKLDPYRRYPLAGGFLCYDRYHTDIIAVRPRDIVCHFAKTPYNARQPRRCVHVLPLDRLAKAVEIPSENIDPQEPTATL